MKRDHLQILGVLRTATLQEKQRPLAHVTGEFTEAQLRTTQWLWETPAPAAQGGVPATVFLVACGMRGLFLASQAHQLSPRSILQGQLAAICLLGVMAAGAWVGSGFHKWITNAL